MTDRIDHRLVMKFGGTSVADLDRIERVARHVAAERANGNQVCVTVSAMAGETNKLVDLAGRAGGEALARSPDVDAVLASGEQVTSGLLSLVLQRMGIPARSWLGWQVRVQTDDVATSATIHSIDAERIEEAFEAGEVAVVAGFQGVSPDGRVTTIGRGGSDTTAVALAAALRASRCDIYTDVDGVYTSDPRIVSNARRLDQISFEEMLEMASVGAKVLHTRSVGIAMAHGVPIRVLSSLSEPGESGACTVIMDESEILERRMVSAVVPSRAEARIALLGVPNLPGRSGLIFGALADAKINIDMIVQSQARAGESANMSFTLKEADLTLAQSVLAGLKDEIGFTDLMADQDVSKVSVIGVGMNDHSGVAAQMFKALGEKGINIHNISTSEIKISALIPADYTELAVRTLHDTFGLGKGSTPD